MSTDLSQELLEVQSQKEGRNCEKRDMDGAVEENQGQMLSVYTAVLMDSPGYRNSVQSDRQILQGFRSGFKCGSGGGLQDPGKYL